MPDFTEVFSKVRELHGRAARILSCSKSMGDGPGPAIEHDDEVFLLAELQIVLDMLADVQERVSYLSRPVIETSRLWKNGSGQYETTQGHCFYDGSPIEVCLPDRYDPDRTNWTRTRLHYDGKDYYLPGYSDVQLEGLAVRIREGDL